MQDFTHISHAIVLRKTSRHNLSYSDFLASHIAAADVYFPHLLDSEETARHDVDEKRRLADLLNVLQSEIVLTAELLDFPADLKHSGNGLVPDVRENHTKPIAVVHILALAFARAEKPHKISTLFHKAEEGITAHNPFAHFDEILDSHN